MSKKTPDNGMDTAPKKRVVESKFDAEKLRILIEEKKSAEEIMNILSIKHKQTLKQYLLRLIGLDRKVYDIPGMYVRNLKRPVLNFKGEIRVTRNMLDFPGSTYSHGDQFEVEPDNEKIVLRRIVDQ
jgi:hypothetical protein